MKLFPRWMLFVADASMNVLNQKSTAVSSPHCSLQSCVQVIKNSERRLALIETRLLHWTGVVTHHGHIWNEDIRFRNGIAHVVEKYEREVFNEALQIDAAFLENCQRQVRQRSLLKCYLSTASSFSAAAWRTSPITRGNSFGDRIQPRAFKFLQSAKSYSVQ